MFTETLLETDFWHRSPSCTQQYNLNYVSSLTFLNKEFTFAISPRALLLQCVLPLMNIEYVRRPKWSWTDRDYASWTSRMLF